jgi:hypothetical protein
MKFCVPALVGLVLLVAAVAGVRSAAAGAPATPPRAAGGRSHAAAACRAAGPIPGPAPLLRLTDVEYHNTLRDLLPGLAEMPRDLTLPPQVRTRGFSNNAQAQTPSPELIERAAANAAAVAAAVTEPAQVVSCRAADASQQVACGVAFVSTFGKRAFRRPLTAGEEARYGRLFNEAFARSGWLEALHQVIEAFLQSPNFLYRVVSGKPLGATRAASPGAVPLTDYELATRISYLLTATTPDAQLMAAADAGALSTPAGIDVQARRLLHDPRARAALSGFYAQWLGLDRIDALMKSPDLFPAFDEAMATAMKVSTSRFVDHVIWEHGGTLRALLTDTHAYVDGRLAPLYGASPPRPGHNDELSLVNVDPAQRAGILTQVGLLAQLAHARSDAPVLRGVFVRDRLLCEEPKPPPRGVKTMLPDLSPESLQTTRQQLERSHSSADCQACHATIDGIGFGFENYDAMGAWRTVDNGVRVDARGFLAGTEDVDGPFDGAVQLGTKLSESNQVRRCVADQWLAYAFGVRPGEIDPCAVDPVLRAFNDAKGDLRELLVAVVKSDAFRFRAAEAVASARGAR